YVVTSNPSFSARTVTVPCSIPVSTVRRKICLISSGFADVVISQSSGSLPSIESLTHPPTAYASKSCSLSFRMIHCTFSGSLILTCSILVCFTPENFVFCRFSAVNTSVGNRLFIFDQTSGSGSACLCLDRFFTAFISTPHRFDESSVVLEFCNHFIHGLCLIDVAVQECFCSCIHILLNCLEKFSQCCRYLVDCYNSLLSCVTSYKDCLAVFDIFRSKFHTYRNSKHLLLAEFPSRTLFGLVDVCT